VFNFCQCYNFNYTIDNSYVDVTALSVIHLPVDLSDLVTGRCSSGCI
jgi:hypothetical protein